MIMRTLFGLLNKTTTVKIDEVLFVFQMILFTKHDLFHPKCCNVLFLGSLEKRNKQIAVYSFMNFDCFGAFSSVVFQYQDQGI